MVDVGGETVYKGVSPWMVRILTAVRAADDFQEQSGKSWIWKLYRPQSISKCSPARDSGEDESC